VLLILLLIYILVIFRQMLHRVHILKDRRQDLRKLVHEIANLIQCKSFCFLFPMILQNYMSVYHCFIFSLAKATPSNPWIADVKKESWDILKKHMRQVTIFKFNSEKQHGDLENVILDALFKGELFVFCSL